MSKPEYITKTATKKDAEGNNVKVDVTFRVDADFVPTSINDVCLEFMMNYCKAKKEGAWLIEKANTTITDKQGKERDYPFVNLRADFMKKFFPSALKGNTPAEKNPMKKRIADFFA